MSLLQYAWYAFIILLCFNVVVIPIIINQLSQVKEIHETSQKSESSSKTVGEGFQVRVYHMRKVQRKLCTDEGNVELNLEKQCEGLTKTIDSQYLLEVEGLSRFANRRAHFINSEKFVRDPSIGPIVLYVYNRPLYFKSVLNGLRNVVGINKTELIISHDGLSPEMDDVAQTIDFMPVGGRVSYSYRQLIHPSRFYRGLGLKEHWWWLLSEVYEVIYPNYDGYITFIEEDHLLAPDFLLVRSALEKTIDEFPAETKKDFWGGCLWSFELNQKPHIMEARWGLYNTGFFYRREMYESIKRNIQLFFECDDGWDVCVHWMIRWELLPGRFLHPRLSRVRNVGRTGLHVTEQIYDDLKFANMTISTSRTFDESTMVLQWPEEPLHPREDCKTLTPPKMVNDHHGRHH